MIDPTIEKVFREEYGRAVAVLVVVDGLVRRRWLLLRDIILALLVEAGLGALLGEAVVSDWTPLNSHLFGRWGFPELRLAGITAILVVAGPELVRPACGARFGIEAEDFRRAFEKADEAIAELRRKLGLK